MANRWARDRANPFYLGFGLVFLMAVLIGFSTTYILPMARRSFTAPPFVHLHGALSLAWVLLFIWQCLLVRTQRAPLHRKIGMLGLPLALGIWTTGMAMALWAAERDLPTVGALATSAIVGTVTTLTMFVALVGAAIAKRRQSDWHKRLMLLATILVLWPAWFRFRHLLPWIPRPDIWLAFIVADLPILIAAVRDRLRYGSVHPAWRWAGSAVIAEQAFEILAFDSPPWRAFGSALYAALN